MDLYAENILDHYRYPRGKKTIADPTVTHSEVNLSCGDRVTVSLTLKGDRIQEFGWDGEGCAVSQAAMSILAEELEGKSLDAIASLTPVHVRAKLGVPISTRRLKCAFLALHALKNLLRVREGLPLQSWEETMNEEYGAAGGN